MPEMNDQVTEQPSLTRKLTDAALIIIAVAAVASWLWRRVRRDTGQQRSTDQQIVNLTPAPALDQKVEADVGFPANPSS